jgi:hypothetical protein
MLLNRDKLISNSAGFLEGGADSVAGSAAQKAVNYKKNIIKNYISIPPELIAERISGEAYVTRKYDGELNVIFYEDGECALINRSGRVKTDLPCCQTAGKLLAAYGVKQAVIPAELYFDETAGRTRVFDVRKALADKTLIDKLRLAPFEIAEIDGAAPKVSSYGETYAILEKIFTDEACKPVLCRKATSAKEVKDIYAQWAEVDGAEGLVVRTASPVIYKVKPKYSIDVAVVGFSEGVGENAGQIRSLLFALINETDGSGRYQIIGRTGGGFTTEERVEFLKRLTPYVLPSSYIETDSNHVAFRMVEPSIVIELAANDVISESSTGPIMNTVVEVKNGSFSRYSAREGLSFISPIYIRERDDKKVVPEDVRLSQLEEFIPVKTEASQEDSERLKSELLRREVYKKDSGDKLMVLKFILWKTNKGRYSDYTEYVVHCTNYSSDRKDRLQREVRVTSDAGQADTLFNDMIAENVKKGWIKVSGV